MFGHCNEDAVDHEKVSEFCIKNDEICIYSDGFVLKMINFVSKMMNGSRKGGAAVQGGRHECVLTIKMKILQ